MAYTPNTYSTDGSVRDFNITFPFLRESDVRVTVFDSAGNELSNTADYDVAIQKPDQTFQIRVVQYGTIGDLGGGTALASGNTVTIERVTDISTLITVFQDGASLRAEDINALITQINYALEEFGQNTTSALGKNVTQTAWDATSLRITNLAQPTANNDAVRKVDVDSGIGPDITTVAGIAANVTTVANDEADIGVIAADISGTNTIGTVSTNIANVNTVSGDIANVNAVAGNATNINAVAGNATNINAVASDAADINTVVANLTDINTVAADTADIGTVAADIQVGGPDNIGTVANAIGDVGIVAGINGQVQTVAGAIANVNTVAADTADVGTVATNIADVNTVAGISSDVTTLAPQAANIGTLTQAANLTALQNAQANAQAAQSALAQLNNKYHGSFTNVAGNDAEVLADIAGNSALTLEAGDLYFDSTNSKLRYYDGSNWYNAAAAQVINTTSLQNVGDVNAYSNLNADDFLKYDGVSGWQNVTPTAVRQAINVEDGATADQTGAEIKALYEQEANAFTDAQFTKLSNISANADVTANAGAVMEADTTTTAMQFVVDEDDMVSDSDTKVPTQQSVKAYADTKQAAITTSSGTINAQALTTRVGNHSGGTTNVDVRQANQVFVGNSVTSVTAEPGASLINVVTASNTTTTVTLPDTLVAGDILSIYHNGSAGTLKVVCSSTGPNNMRINGQAGNISNPTTTGVTIGGDTIATVTMVGNEIALVAGSDVT